MPDTRALLERSYAFGIKIGVETWDPFDIKGSRLSMWTYAGRSPLHTLVRKGLQGCDLFFPRVSRRVLGLKKSASHGGAARWLQANATMARLLTAEGRDATSTLGACNGLTKWLIENPAKTPIGTGWGLPFEWQAFVPVPANTGIGHTTMAVANALLDWKESAVSLGTNWDDRIDRVVESAVTFLAEGLNHTVGSSGSVALSYTPLDKSQVVNTNAEIAALFLRTGSHTDLAKNILRFVAESVNSDGSWFYSAPNANEGRQVVDHYHTGMILDALHGSLSHESGLQELFTRGLEFHLVRHFGQDGSPKMRPDTPWPIDAYSAGQSLLVLNRFSTSPHLGERLKVECRDKCDRLLAYVSESMAFPDGGFVYRKWPMSTMRLDSLRWAQALIVHALAEKCLASVQSK